LEHSTKRLAVSLVALLALLAFFATVSAAAQGVADSPAPIIDPAIDEAAYVRVVAEGAFPSKLPSASRNLLR
jgi:hypothetical protein